MVTGIRSRLTNLPVSAETSGPGPLGFIEAPNTTLQAHLITRIGPNVNLGNVPAAGVIGLETLRLGLRSDTLTAFEQR